MQLLVLESLAALRAVAPFWDALWATAPGCVPLARAEHVAQWVEQFAPQSTFRALVVRDGDRFLAALPLVEHRVRGWLPVGALPTNEWSEGGRLLLEARCDVPAVMDRLIAGFRQLPWPLVWLSGIELEAPANAQLVARLQAGSAAFLERLVYCSGRVLLAATWDTYFAQRTKKHRANMRRNLARLREQGSTGFRLIEHATADEVEALMRRGFEVERHSWKAQQGSTVLDEPRMLEYYIRQARQLAELGCLWLTFLEHAGEPIAFDYGYTAHGTYYRVKICYDARFAIYSPGQLLACFEIELLHQRPGFREVDFLGPASDALDKWINQSYAVGRLVVARPGMAGRLLIAAYRWFARWKDARHSCPAVAPTPEAKTPTTAAHPTAAPPRTTPGVAAPAPAVSPAPLPAPIPVVPWQPIADLPSEVR